MQELYDAWTDAPSLSELPELPPFSEFEECYEEIDVGYDCFIGKAFVSGPYAIIYDEEKYRRDTWGWSCVISYIDGNRSTYATPALKCRSHEEAYDKLAEYCKNI